MIRPKAIFNSRSWLGTILAAWVIGHVLLLIVVLAGEVP